MNVSDALTEATVKLEMGGVPNSIREARSLLALTLKKDLSFLIARPEYTLSPEEAGTFTERIDRRTAREPFQYLTGYQEFYGLAFEVTRDVLIPRPETAILVETAIEVLAGRDNSRFLELGVGSGCISVSILHSIASATAIAVDISRAALETARRNASRHGVSERLDLVLGDLFAGIQENFDVIVSNPPYVPDGDIDSLQAEVRDFEPHAALAGGADGLDIVRRIIRGCSKHLNPGGNLILEIGFGQAEAVSDLLAPDIWLTPSILPDFQGIPRIVAARRNK